MNKRLKDIYFSREFIDRLSSAICGAYPAFDASHFAQSVFDETWEGRELKDRMRHVTRCLHVVMPADYPVALDILCQVAAAFLSFDAMVFSDYVATYGLEYFDRSMEALGFLTRFMSAEFAVRPFLARDPDRGMAFMREWAGDEDANVRRLASEGCRPRLPWATALPTFKEDPSPILPVLEILKDDPSEAVRRSVANNLNDISKDHPELVLDICKEWQGASAEVDWVVKHACRTLLKAGDTRAMRLFGFADPAQIHVVNLALDRDTVPIGQDVSISFDLVLEGDGTRNVRLELAVHYVKARGKVSRKIFQIKEAKLGEGYHRIERKLSFLDRSTRKHYPGRHVLEIVVNGVEKAHIAVEVRPAVYQTHDPTVAS